jgi:hypothetical protein
MYIYVFKHNILCIFEEKKKKDYIYMLKKLHNLLNKFIKKKVIFKYLE